MVERLRAARGRERLRVRRALHAVRQERPGGRHLEPGRRDGQRAGVQVAAVLRHRRGLRRVRELAGAGVVRGGVGGRLRRAALRARRAAGLPGDLRPDAGGDPAQVHRADRPPGAAAALVVRAVAVDVVPHRLRRADRERARRGHGRARDPAERLPLRLLLDEAAAVVRLRVGPRRVPRARGDAAAPGRPRPAPQRVDQPVHRAAVAAVRARPRRRATSSAGPTAACGSGTCGWPAWGWSTSRTPRRASGSRARSAAVLESGVDAVKTDFGERIPDGRRVVRRLGPAADAQLLQLPLQPHRVRGRGGAPGRRRGRPVRPLGHGGRPAVPGALGRRLRVDVRVDGGVAARRAVARPRRVRLLEPRHRRLRGHAARGAVQALGGVRADVLALAPARLELAPRALGVRRGGRRRHARVRPAEELADAVPVGGRGAGARRRASR